MIYNETYLGQDLVLEEDFSCDGLGMTSAFDNVEENGTLEVNTSLALQWLLRLYCKPDG